MLINHVENCWVSQEISRNVILKWTQQDSNLRKDKSQESHHLTEKDSKKKRHRPAHWEADSRAYHRV
jgi:hypothetical protein